MLGFYYWWHFSALFNCGSVPLGLCCNYVLLFPFRLSFATIFCYANLVILFCESINKTCSTVVHTLQHLKLTLNGTNYSCSWWKPLLRSVQ